MNVQQRGIITLIKSALTGKCYELPENFSLESVIDIARKHQISPLIYYGAINCGFDKNSEAVCSLFNNALPLVMLDEQQRTLLDELFIAFKTNGIEYVPLKGSVLKALYPKPEMRIMGDIDILIKTEQYETIKKIMLDFGLGEKVESDHEYVWVRGNLCLELHKRLIPSYNKDYYAYFGDGWELAKRCDGFSKWRLKSETEFVYLFTHFAKHYRDGGIGIKHLTDLWVYKNAKPELDWQYMKNELKKLRLYEFFKNVEKTLTAWFADGEETLETKLISDTIFGRGAYGDAEVAAASRIIRETEGKKCVTRAKLSYLIKMVFQPYNLMCKKYVALKKLPFLLPIMWIVRLFSIAMFKRDRMVDFINRQKRLTNDAVYGQKEKLNAVGLDFYLEEDVK